MSISRSVGWESQLLVEACRRFDFDFVQSALNPNFIERMYLAKKYRHCELGALAARGRMY